MADHRLTRRSLLALALLPGAGAVQAAPRPLGPGRIYDPTGLWEGTFQRPNRANGVAEGYFFLDQGGRALDGGVTLYGDNDEVFILPFRGQVVGRNVISGRIEGPDGRFGRLRGHVNLRSEVMSLNFSFPRDRARVTGTVRLTRSRG